jgi:hypothetical protein
MMKTEDMMLGTCTANIILHTLVYTGVPLLYAMFNSMGSGHHM